VKKKPKVKPLKEKLQEKTSLDTFKAWLEKKGRLPKKG